MMIFISNSNNQMNKIKYLLIFQTINIEKNIKIEEKTDINNYT